MYFTTKPPAIIAITKSAVSYTFQPPRLRDASTSAVNRHSVFHLLWQNRDMNTKLHVQSNLLSLSRPSSII